MDDKIMVNIMIRVPDGMDETIRNLSKRKLANMDIVISNANILFFLAGGIIIAINIP